MLTNAFSFFSNYSELSEDELKEQMEINGGIYTRTICVDKIEDIEKIVLDVDNHEKNISQDKILGYNRETGYEDIFFEVIIEGERTFESYKEAHIEKLNTLIIKNKHTIIQSLKSIYKDLAFPNKREVCLKTVHQIKGLKENYNSVKFLNNGLLTESLKEIFNSVKPFALLYPDIASSNDFVGLEVYFEGIDQRIKLKVTPQQAKAVLKCLTETPDNWDDPLITETDLDYFLSKNFQGFDMVHEDKIIRLNIGQKYNGLVWSIFHWFYSHCTRNVTKEMIVIIILNSFPNNFTKKPANYIKNMKKDSELNEKLRKIGITSYPAL